MIARTMLKMDVRIRGIIMGQSQMKVSYVVVRGGGEPKNIQLFGTLVLYFTFRVLLGGRAY